MSAHWKELLPVDQYSVRRSESIDLFHLTILSALYQPLIGPLACQLYTTLLFEVEGEGQPRSHYHLMLGMASTLEVLFTERKKLEAIGLLSVYKKELQEAAHFIYELKRPLEPNMFFSDGLLNIYLFNRVGKMEYLRLKNRFSLNQEDLQDYKEVTVPFSDVFSSIHPSELKNGHLDAGPVIHEPSHPFPKLAVEFDFSQLMRQLSDVIISEKALTEPIKEAIRQLSFVYNVGPNEMAQIIQQAFLHTGEIDIPTLRKAVRRAYQMENGDQLPSLSLRAEKPKLEHDGERPPESDFEAQIRLFETLSPHELLRNMAGGAEPVQSDLRIVEGLLLDQLLPPGVVNVLLDYTMLVNDKKLIKSYIEKIASHWARKKVSTVREAMALAKEEHKKYQTWKQAPKSSRSNGQTVKRKANPRQERLPKWMKPESNQVEKPKDQVAAVQVAEEETNREQWLENFLNNL